MRAALVLAAGASRRFGRRDKLAERLCGRTLLEHAIARAREAGVGRVLVTFSSLPCDRVARNDVILVRSPHAKLGLGASLEAGLAALRPIEREVLVFLADMPFAVAPRLRLTAGIDAVRPTVDGRPGHPMLVRSVVARRLVDAGDRGLAAALRRIAFVPGAEGNLIDIDTPEALRRLRHRIAGAGGALRLSNRERRCLRPHNGSRPPRR